MEEVVGPGPIHELRPGPTEFSAQGPMKFNRSFSNFQMDVTLKKKKFFCLFLLQKKLLYNIYVHYIAPITCIQ